MRGLTRSVVLAVIAAAVSVSAGLGAAAAGSGGPIVKTVGKFLIVPGQYAKDTVHFTPRVITVKSGETVTFKKIDKDPEPHTVTLSAKADLPKTAADLERCKPCRIALGHLKNPKNENSPIKTYVLDKGLPGFDVVGDSLALAPKGPHKSGSVVISAPPGTTLYFVCAVHPWMQGEIKVI